jgi:hypothetical protein
MKTNVLSAIASVAVLAFPLAAFSKGQIAKIVVASKDSPTALEVTDAAILGSFDIWHGPGVRVNGQPVHLNAEDPGPAFINWLTDEKVERSSSLLRYQVTFVIEGRARGAYVVLYEFDPEVAGGYIYLPGTGDAHGSENVRLIYHGVEGRWFHSSAAWEWLVRPLVMDAQSRLSSGR